jgi:DNA-binding transcriptional MocR family regulator
MLAACTPGGESASSGGAATVVQAYFYPGGGGDHGIRLSTSYLSPAEIEEGTARLARFIQAETVGTDGGGR